MSWLKSAIYEVNDSAPSFIKCNSWWWALYHFNFTFFLFHEFCNDIEFSIFYN